MKTMKKKNKESLNLLERLNSNDSPVKDGSPENMDLTLGLSLNGRYGWDPQRNKDNKLLRASSVRGIGNMNIELTLSRTCSLPAETEVEWRKRKELEMLRRMNVKRKKVDQKLKKHSPPLPISKTLLASEKVKVCSQESIGSQGSGAGSSGVSDLDTQPFSGTNRDTSETSERPEVNKVQCTLKTKPNKHSVIDQTMPCVSTKVDGPDGKRIQGFLYRYGKGQEVRIVCVCHGSFLTPTEFVKHGGGGDVEHPLRHIVVTSSLFS